MTTRGTEGPLAGAHADCRRKRSYRARVTHCDYFVEKHVGSFVRDRLRRLVSGGTRVGDVGCGEQPFREQVEALGGSYVGVDAAQNRAGTVSVLADAVALPFPEGSFDIVLCTEVLEHAPDPRRAVAEMARVTKAGGHLILTAPFMYPLHEEPRDYARLTPYWIREYAKPSGLEIEDLRRAGNELEVMASVWANLWCRSSLANRCLLADRFLLPLLFAPVNALCGASSCLLHRLLPRKYYLSLLCTLIKR